MCIKKLIFPIILLVFFISCNFNPTNNLIPNNNQDEENYNRSIVAIDDSGEIIESNNGIDWTSCNKESIGSPNQIIRVSSKNPLSRNSKSLTDSILVGTTYYDIYYSVDNGISWTKVKTVEGINDMAYSDGTYLIVGGGRGFIERSTDGKNWETVLSGGSRIESVAFGPDIIVATGSCERVVTSVDSGQTWNDNGGEDNQSRFDSLIYGSDKFVAVGTAINGLSSRWATSVDGINWENITVDSNYHTMWDIAYGLGTYVTGGYHYILSSEDGITWSNPYTTEAEIHNINFLNDFFIATGSNTYNGYPVVLYSSDIGLTWNEIDVSDLIDEPITAGNVEYFNNNDRYLTSIDGIIVNNSGDIIPNAFIMYFDLDINTSEYNYSDTNGYFNIQLEHNGDAEILIVSDDYKNKQFTITTSDQTYNLGEIVMVNTN